MKVAIRKPKDIIESHGYAEAFAEVDMERVPCIGEHFQMFGSSFVVKDVVNIMEGWQMSYEILLEYCL